ncbi:MAG: PQQ-dependent sugar dehydrogenase [Gammaproteobacteria bacterium]|nr:PQQ-dependent sugar dehydrogenase [Gammaproteobacteria bacterium]
MKHVVIILMLFFTTLAHSDDFQIDTLASGLGVPWGMTVLPDGNLLISQRQGELTHLNISTRKLTAMSGLPEIKVEGQGGLFDVALPPDFTIGSWLYFSYNKDIGGQGATTLARAKLENFKLVDWQDLLITHSRTKNKVHYGGRLTFDNNGHIFISVGERGLRSNAQDLLTHAGSILRLNLDGSVPKDNPFVDNPQALPEIWSVGHRNPQGLFYNRDTQQLWESEHGPRGGDEINLIEAGKNYGWPVISYGKEYWSPLPVGKGTHQQGMEQPVKVYIPSIATSSIIQYSGKAFSDWKGNLLAGALNVQHLNRIILDENNQAIDEQRYLQSLNSRIRNVVESPEGWLYVATDNGRILRIKPADNEWQ